MRGAGKLIWSVAKEVSRVALHLGRLSNFYKFATKVALVDVDHLVQLNCILIYLKLDRISYLKQKVFVFPSAVSQTDDYVTISWYKEGKVARLSVNGVCVRLECCILGVTQFVEDSELPVNTNSSILTGLTLFLFDN